VPQRPRLGRRQVEREDREARGVQVALRLLADRDDVGVLGDRPERLDVGPVVPEDRVVTAQPRPFGMRVAVTLVVLGGDGTIRTAAEACTGTDTYLIPLPGGTLNVLSRALYGDSSWQEALKETLANPLTKELSGGRVGDKLFFVAAVVGAPGLWMEAREAIREGDILNAVGKVGVAFEAMFDTTIQYFISPEVSGKA
jgi:hypothetical protein